jgi:hypothetical protein
MNESTLIVRNLLKPRLTGQRTVELPGQPLPLEVISHTTDGSDQLPEGSQLALDSDDLDINWSLARGLDY